MWSNRDWAAVSFSAAFPQVPNQLFAGIQLGSGRLIAIEIADQTDPERDVVEKIAVHVTSVNLTAPSIANLDFAVAGGSAVTDDEMIGESILHSPDPSVVIIKHPCVALSGA